MQNCSVMHTGATLGGRCAVSRPTSLLTARCRSKSSQLWSAVAEGRHVLCPIGRDSRDAHMVCSALQMRGRIACG